MSECIHFIIIITTIISGSAARGLWPPHFTRFLDHTRWRTTAGKTPLDEWSARHRDLYLTTDKHPRPWWDSNPRSQQASSRRPIPYTMRPLGPAFILIIPYKNHVQATLVIRNLTLRVFAITRFRGEKKPWENCTVILQSPCTMVTWLCGARTSWSHLTSISVRGSVELASPVDVEGNGKKK
jgi:hypothetical protein